MLLQFTVGNYRSFREKTTFSLVAEPKERGHENTLRNAQNAAGVNVLSLAALYGANASGKSNLLEAIYIFQQLVTKGVAPNEPIPVDRFLLGGGSFADTEPTFMEAYFVFGNEMYCYGLECDVRHIQHEWLRVGQEETSLFERYTDASGNVTVKNYAELARLSKTKQERIELIAEGTRENQPFLTQAVEQNVIRARDIVFRIQNSLIVVTLDARDSRAAITMDNTPDSVKRLGNFLKFADTGIDKVELQYEPFDLSQLPEEQRRKIEMELLYDEDSYITFMPRNELITIKKNKETGNTVLVRLRARHTDQTGANVALDWSSESDGTRRMTELWQILFMHMNEGVTFFIDEIERSLHPELIRYILEQWRVFAPLNGQLIFTTHNDNLLEDDLLRRDEVWFVSKDKTGASNIVSETQFKSVEGVTRQRAYLDGMYGGTPRIPSRGFYSVSRDFREDVK